MDIFYTTFVGFWSYRFLWGPMLLLLVTYPIWTSIWDMAIIVGILLKDLCDKDRRLKCFFNNLLLYHEKTEWYLHGDHLEIFVTDAEGRILLEDIYLSKKQMRRLNEIGHLKNEHAFVVDGYENCFNY